MQSSRPVSKPISLQDIPRIVQQLSRGYLDDEKVANLERIKAIDRILDCHALVARQAEQLGENMKTGSKGIATRSKELETALENLLTGLSELDKLNKPKPREYWELPKTDGIRNDMETATSLLEALRKAQSNTA